MERIKLYMYSVSRYGKSPFIYPVYGLGGLPEGFTRLCAVNGGTYMLGAPVESFELDSEGRVCGVKTKDGQVTCIRPQRHRADLSRRGLGVGNRRAGNF